MWPLGLSTLLVHREADTRQEDGHSVPSSLGLGDIRTGKRILWFVLGPEHTAIVTKGNKVRRQGRGQAS